MLALAKLVKKQYYVLLMLSLVVLATALRITLISHNWPGTNSDEATIDLMALHIAYHGEHPIFFYGQGYMGAIQAYIGALLFHIFGVSIFSVRLGLVLMYALFLIGMYYLTSLLYTRAFALCVVGLLAFGSSDLLTVQMLANGGYAETRVFGVFIALIAFWLAYTSRPPEQQHKRSTLDVGEPDLYDVASPRRKQSPRLRRSLLYGLLGLCTGLALWSDLLILPCVLTSGLLLGFYCRREILSRSGLLLLIGFFVGFMPTILYNLAAPANSDSLHALVGTTRYTASRNGVTLFQQILQALVITLSRATGVHPACYMLEPMHSAGSIADLYPGSSSNPTQCFVIEGSWGLGAIIAWCIAFIVVVLPLWRYYIHILKKRRIEPISLHIGHAYEKRKDQVILSQEMHRLYILHFARFALLVSVALSFILYMFSFPAAAVPRSTSRYLICLFFALPVVLWPLWHGISKSMKLYTRLKERHSLVKLVGMFMRSGLLLSIFMMFVVGMLDTWSEVPRNEAAYASQAHLTQELLDLGVTRIYSDYWTCARLTFQSQERLICAALDEHLQTGLDRYMPYRDIVHANPHPGYVFRDNSDQARILSSTLGNRYRRYLFDNYVVYAYRN
jgi:hypothetical protein